MSLSDPRIVYGVHSVSPYKRTDGTFYGILKVLGSSTLALAGELVEQNGGSFPYPWDVQNGLIKPELALKMKEYPNFVFELFLGQAPTTNAAEANGNVSALTNKLGTTAQSATIGVASVAFIPTTGPANLKFGKYVIVVASATTIDVYLSTDIDFKHGTSGSYLADSLKIASGLTITTGGNTDSTGYGLRFVGGSGTIGMTIGDTATFNVRPPNTASTTVRVGDPSSVFPEFGALIMAQKKGNGEMVELDAFKVKGIGLPIGFEERKFSEPDIKAKLLFDSVKNGVFDLTHVIPA